MNTIFKRVISGAAALGIAVSGLAIGVSTAYAADRSATFTAGPLRNLKPPIFHSDMGRQALSKMHPFSSAER